MTPHRPNSLPNSLPTSLPTSPRAAREAAGASDQDIMGRLACGDGGALGELYDRYQQRVRRFVAHATCDAEDVDDLVHLTFLAAARSAGRYDGRLSCRPWLVGIAAQLLRRRRRAVARFFAVVSSAAGGRATHFDPGAMLQARSDVQRALFRISEAKRITFVMAEVEGLTCPEIAEALQIPIGTVWTRLHAARRELRRMLEEGGQP
jgi:RNA polymerase sigma-70 factor (ECF subfamily)